MLILGIDTGTAACCAAVYDTERQIFIARSEINNRLTHSMTLMPMINDMLSQSGCKPEEIGLIAVCTGPGSFTGIRIGVASAKGLAVGWNIPCVGITSCEAAAYALPIRRGIICSVLDAKINRLYCALFKADGDKVKRLTDEQCLTPEEVLELLGGYETEELIITGDGARILAEALKDTKKATVLPVWAAQQTACGVCLAAGYHTPEPPERILPVYVQLPQAQRELNARLKGKE